MKEQKQQKPLVQSVERALDILDLIGDREKPMRASDIADELNLHGSTSHNIIRTLYRRGYLSQSSSGKYYIGLQCYRLGELCDRWGILRNESMIHLEELSEETGDNSILASESGGRLITIASAEGAGDIVITKHHPDRDHLYCTAIGKVIMAYASDEYLKLYKKNVEIKKFTDSTVESWEQLEEQLRGVKNDGYCHNNCESRKHVAALAVPVFDEKEQLLCALGQSFPDFFIKSKQIDIEERVSLLKKYAEKVRQDYCSGFNKAICDET